MSQLATNQHVITGSTIVGQSSKSSARNVEGVKRVNAFTIPLDKIKEVDGFNARMDSAENAEHIDQMARAFANGVTPEPVRVVPITLENGEQAFKLFDGQCTTRAAHRANNKYGGKITDLSARVYDISEKEQRLAISTTNRQKKLNMIENGKVYHELTSMDGMTQTQVAESIGITQTDVSNCISAYLMPDSLKELVAKGILTDNETFLLYRREIRVKGDQEETERKASLFSMMALKRSADQVAEGGSPKVKLNAPAGKAKKVRIGAEQRETLTSAYGVINELLEGADDTAETVTVSLNKEQLEAMKKAGAIFA